MPQTRRLFGLQKAMDVSLTRVSGVHQDFPFDSARFDFDLSWDPLVRLNNFVLRNRNPSFDLACSTYEVQGDGVGKVHISFEARRNPLVQLTAVVLVSAGFLFLIDPSEDTANQYLCLRLHRRHHLYQY